MKVIAVIPGSPSGSSMIFARRMVEHINSTKGMSCVPFYTGTSHGLLAMVKKGLDFKRLERKFRPDVVHVHFGTTTSIFSLIFARSLFVITFRGSDINPNAGYGKAVGVIAHFMSQVSACFSASNICVSR